jgi:hypothetical protein
LIAAVIRGRGSEGRRENRVVSERPRRRGCRPEDILENRGQRPIRIEQRQRYLPLRFMTANIITPNVIGIAVHIQGVMMVPMPEKRHSKMQWPDPQAESRRGRRSKKNNR